MGVAHNHVDDGVDGFLHIDTLGWLQAGGSEVAAVGLVCGNDVEPLVLGLGGGEGRVRPAGTHAGPVPRDYPGGLHPLSREVLQGALRAPFAVLASGTLQGASLLCGPYQVVGGDGNREHFDPQMLGFICSIIQASTGLLVSFQGVSISHHDQIFILLVMGATARV